MDRGWKPNVEIPPTCPRCGSTNTKFCYYNNYSLTQPRYFCKGCRRYWTKGGSLRNVPVGGGCRKRRRGSSSRPNISASIDSVTSRGTFATSMATPLGGYCGAITTSLSSLGAAAGASDHHHGPSIDLALVYANFLNTKPSEPDPNNIIGPNSFQFSSSTTSQLAADQENSSDHVFLECGSISDRSSDTHMSAGNQIFYLDGTDTFENDHHLISCGHQIDNNSYNILPPLPGEETVSEGMVWPSSDLMFPTSGHHQAHATTLSPQMQDSNQLDGVNGSFFHITNYSIFSGLDK